MADDSRWVSEAVPDPKWLLFSFEEPQTLGSVHVYTGYRDGDAAKEFRFEIKQGGDWRPVRGASVRGNTKTATRLIFDKPVETKQIRFVASDPGHARVKEIAFFEPAADASSPALGSGVTDFVPPVDPTRHYVFVNQSGYNASWPKRFTAPNSPDRSRFEVQSAGGAVVFRGRIDAGVGDFSAIDVPVDDGELTIHVSGGDMEPGVSDPFRIAPSLIEDTSREPALRFMQDARSVVGTHPSAYGGSPWRDGTYYSFEVPSLVLLYLSAPDYFDSIPVELDHSADAVRIGDPEFKIVKATQGAGVLDTVRRYFREIDPPASRNTPDIHQVIHWGIGMYLLDPTSKDPSGDPLGEQVHAQTVEQFAFFLFGYPHFAEHYTPAFYARANKFAFDNWGSVGLFDVDTKIGAFKGRHCPGHSIMPNLMMHETALREGRSDADLYLDAAVRQAEWCVANLDWENPLVTKGQRMSEHKLLTGLVMLLSAHPEAAPAGLADKLNAWADVMIRRSDNMWDFRKYDDKDWSLPRFTPGSHGGAGWNEPGNVAAFPGLCFAVARLLDDQTKADRLKEIGVAHFDCLFGRNPLGAHSAADGPKHFAGVERGWPKHFHKDWCARLELVRGTLNSSPASEHFPFNPQGPFRHPEGWTAFNAAFNVGLAYACWNNDALDPGSLGAGVDRPSRP